MPKRLHAALSERAKDEGISLNTYIVTLLSEMHIERKLLKEISALKRKLEVMYSQIVSDTYSASNSFHKIEDPIDKYRTKKYKKK